LSITVGTAIATVETTAIATVEATAIATVETTNLITTEAMGLPMETNTKNPLKLTKREATNE
jgi:hypothetical protein